MGSTISFPTGSTAYSFQNADDNRKGRPNKWLKCLGARLRDQKYRFSPAKTDKLEDFHSSGRSSWQIPEGVSQGTWDYVRARSIASEYGEFLKQDPLTRLDWQIVCRWLPAIELRDPPTTVIEFGCGDGRTLIPLIARGYQCVGVDLSIPMLQEMEKRFHQYSEPLNSEASEFSRSRLTSIQANLVRLECLRENSVDHAVCLFSTLGMIRQARYRRQFLNHARRIIRAKGHFILHAHNVWSQLRDRGGLKWFAKHLVEVAKKQNDFGDRFSDYRGIRNMFIHSFRKRELIGLLDASGFTVQKIYPVTRTLLDQIESCDNNNEPSMAEALDRSRTAGMFKTIGWVVVCQ